MKDKTLKILVTGGAGFIGSHIVDRLIADGHEVNIIDNLSTGKIENINPAATWISADITDYDAILPHFSGIDAVFHTAAWARILPSIEDPVSHHKTNTLGTLNVLLASHRSGVKKVIYSSSSSVYSPGVKTPTGENASICPASPYGLQKYMGELYCKLFAEQYGLTCIALRYFNVYGNRSFNEKNPLNAYSSVAGIFVNQKKRGQALTITGDGLQSRDFIYVKDVVSANVGLLDYTPRKFEVFNVGSGRSVSVKTIADIISPNQVFIPGRPGEARFTLADISKLKRHTGWQPRFDLELGIADTMEDEKPLLKRQ